MRTYVDLCKASRLYAGLTYALEEEFNEGLIERGVAATLMWSI